MKLSLIIAISLAWCHASYGQEAFVTVPVADLVGKPLIQQKPISIEGQGANSCARLHQLIFNERVTVEEITGEWARVSIPHLYYITPQDQHKKHTTYWTRKECLTLMADLPLEHHQNIPSSNIVKPLAANITLALPWYDHKTHTHYSVGTRFMIDKKVGKRHYHAFIFNPTLQEFVIRKIPKKLCLQLSPTITKQERINLFVQLLGLWAHLDYGFIPYVWGGCSFTQPCTHHGFKILPIHKNATATNVHQYGFNLEPFAGFDCAGLITRAAQMCGIPYCYKNSYTIAKKMPALEPHEAIEPGDIIWIPGHVMVVANTKTNTLIEARSYYHGYGKVQEIKLSEEFKDIKTYAELKKALMTNTGLERLNSKGEVVQKISQFKILKLAHLFGG